MISGAVHIDRPYGALNTFHTGGSVVGVGVAILVLNMTWLLVGASRTNRTRESQRGTVPSKVNVGLFPAWVCRISICACDINLRGDFWMDGWMHAWMDLSR